MPPPRWNNKKSSRILFDYQPLATTPSTHFLKTIVSHDQNESLSLSTRKKYMYAWRSFFNFCQTLNLPFKPTTKNLCFYISITSRSISPCSVEVYLSGVSYMFKSRCPHILCETNHSSVCWTLRGCKKQFSKPVVRKDPLALKDLERACSLLDRSFDNTLFLAILSLGFAGLHRLGELVIPDDSTLFDNHKIIQRGSLSFSKCSKFAKYLLPYHKGDPDFL